MTSACEGSSNSLFTYAASNLRRLCCEYDSDDDSYAEFSPDDDEDRSAKKILKMAMKKDMAIKIAKNATFTELTEGYFLTTDWEHDVTSKGIQYYNIERKTEYVAMNKPITCTYQKQRFSWSKNTYENIITPTEIPVSCKNIPTIPPIEYRGITLRQLRAVMANVTRRCVAEGWTDPKGKELTAGTVSFYDLEMYVIWPFTVKKKQPFVMCLPSTAGPQPPRLFVSHWWGQSVKDFLECIEQLVRDFGRNARTQDDQKGSGLTLDTPLWICAVAEDPWNISEIGEEAEVEKAMKVAEHRLITILDEEGVVFSRIWCIFELFLTIVDVLQENGDEKSKEGLWMVYTAKSHVYKDPHDSTEEQERKAVGTIPGGTPGDLDDANSIIARERCFPFELISKSLPIKVEDACASIDSDVINIIKFMMGKVSGGIDDVPPLAEKNYNAMNDALRDMLSSTIGRCHRIRCTGKSR